MSQFKTKLEKSVNVLTESAVNRPWEVKEWYAEYLAQTFYYITHTTKLLKFASEHAKNPELRECLLHHVKEENGHEHWAAKDLKNLGYDLKSFPESKLTQGLYGQIYDGIKKHGPAPIIGYAMALEGMSANACPKVAPILIEKYGEKCASFIKNHAVIDQEHAKEGVNILAFFNDMDMAVIADYIDLSTKAYVEFLDSIGRQEKRQTA